MLISIINRSPKFYDIHRFGLNFRGTTSRRVVPNVVLTDSPSACRKTENIRLLLIFVP